MTPLRVSVKSGNFEFFKWLIESEGADFNELDSRSTILNYTLFLPSLSKFSLYLINKDYVFSPKNLSVAAANSTAEVVKALIKKRLKPKEVLASKTNPLHHWPEASFEFVAGLKYDLVA